MVEITRYFDLGQATDSKDLHASAENTLKANLSGANKLLMGSVVSMSAGQVIAFNGTPYGIITNANRRYVEANNYAQDGTAVSIEVSKKGVRLALCADTTIKKGDMLTVNTNGVFAKTTDNTVAVAFAWGDSFSFNSSNCVEVDFNFSIPLNTTPSTGGASAEINSAKVEVKEEEPTEENTKPQESSNKPNGNKPAGNKPNGNKPAGNKPNGNNSLSV
ncbi:MAG: hypothetical protein LBQ34_07670 [Alphaproteobacteria bacterium]|jgi:hypothetical protein|nr:hypothetical protein [Alphaproteobacteria bacterium]